MKCDRDIRVIRHSAFAASLTACVCLGIAPRCSAETIFC